MSLLPRHKLLPICVPPPIQFFIQALTSQAVSKFPEPREPSMSWIFGRQASLCLPALEGGLVYIWGWHFINIKINMNPEQKSSDKSKLAQGRGTRGKR